MGGHDMPPSHKKVGHTGRLRFKRQEQRQPCGRLHQRAGQRDEGGAIEVRQPTYWEGQNDLQQPLGPERITQDSWQSDVKCQNRFVAKVRGKYFTKF